VIGYQKNHAIKIINAFCEPKEYCKNTYLSSEIDNSDTIEKIYYKNIFFNEYPNMESIVKYFCMPKYNIIDSLSMY
jgi:hypothetical protein